MGVYDQAGRYLIRKKPLPVLRRLVPRLMERFLWQRWVDTGLPAFPGDPDRICDLIAELRHHDQTEAPRLLDIELQAAPLSDMLERAGEYAYRLRREVRHGPTGTDKYLVLTVLINLTGAAQAPELLMVDEAQDLGYRARVVVWTLREDDAAATLAQIASDAEKRCLLPWIPLMHHGGEEAIIGEWKRLAAQETDDRWRADYGGLALVFAELAGCAAQWRAALKEWNVQQSQQVLEWQEAARKETRKETELQNARAYLLRALQLRFQGPVPADLASAIAALQDGEELSRWFDAALTAASLEAFRAAVKH
jgi:hypothetical protein